MNYEINLVSVLDGFTNLNPVNPEGELISACGLCGFGICICNEPPMYSLYAVPPVKY